MPNVSGSNAARKAEAFVNIIGGNSQSGYNNRDAAFINFLTINAKLHELQIQTLRNRDQKSDQTAQESVGLSHSSTPNQCDQPGNGAHWHLSQMGDEYSYAGDCSPG